MPNRILRESVCTSESVDKLTWFEEVLYYRLIVNCDDFGRFDGRAAVIKSRLFPLKDNLTLKTVETALHGLANAGLVALYVFEGKRFLCLPTWGKYQTQRAKVSKYPAPDCNVQLSANMCEHMPADENICEQAQSNDSKCSRIRESNSIFDIRESGIENNAREARFTPPSVEEVAAYCKERRNGVDAARFVDFYSSKGWMVGKTKMKDWKAAIRNWERSSDAKATPAKKPGYNVQHHGDELSDVQRAAIRQMMEDGA